MKRMSQLDAYSISPKLEDMVNIYINPLPEWAEFLQNWISKTKSKKDLQYDTWYREAVYLLKGAPGLEGLVKTEGAKRPRAYIGWIHALIENKDDKNALLATQFAL